MFGMKKYIIYDFNGTVLDDVKVSLAAINVLSRKYLAKEIYLAEYHKCFTFPISSYYQNVGFDFSLKPFEEIGLEWVKEYNSRRSEYELFPGIVDQLESNRQKVKKNILLSASDLDMLKEQLRELGIFELFDEVLGIDNVFAKSKLPIALGFIKDKNPDECVMIGDTLHDLEVARGMGVDCILVANGHQSYESLKKEYDRVVRDIREVDYD